MKNKFPLQIMKTIKIYTNHFEFPFSSLKRKSLPAIFHQFSKNMQHDNNEIDELLNDC